ncbi:methyltransferase [Geodermatophilus sp. CPCC 206100]|uniref:methyltransferase n=1 Tax=Geodermatophilus sp. CPCC 206100 TaxID=3020054 RepID=UPI003B009635
MTEPAQQLARLGDLLTPYAVRTAATLRLADHVAAGHERVDELAAAAGADPRALRALLRQLAVAGVVALDPDGRIALTPVGELLRSDVPGSWRAHLALDGAPGLMQRAWAALPDAVRTGRAGFPDVAGGGFWEVVGGDPELTASFAAHLGDWAAQWVPVVAGLLPLEDARLVVDVGGGSGVLLGALLDRHAHLRGVLVDLPAATEQAARHLAGCGVADRVDLRPGSFFDPLPGGGDVYLLAQVLHDWPDPEANALLARVAEAAGPGARVVVVERLADAGAGHPAMDLLMLNLFGSRERTHEEYSALARAAGLHPVSAVPTDVGLHLLTFAVPTAPEGAP